MTLKTKKRASLGLLLILGVLGVLLLMTVTANTEMLSPTYGVIPQQGPNLPAESHDNGATNPFDYDSYAEELMRFAPLHIHTMSTSAGWNDPESHTASSGFMFTPPPGSGSAAGGQTSGDQNGAPSDPYQGGSSNWGGPTPFHSSPNNDGPPQIALLGPGPSGGFGGSGPSEGFGGAGSGPTNNGSNPIPDEAFTPTENTTPGAADGGLEPGVADVPEPGVVLLFGLTLLGMAFVIRRRRKAAI